MGESGCGKTTILKLILGFYQVDKGDILINGVNINSVDLNQWYSKCGVVMQDSYLFSETIEDNIVINNRANNAQRLKNVLRAVNLEKDILDMPLGIHTQIGMEGVQLSQGQKQRVLLARAIYKNPEYLILDEATNALDSKNECEIISNFRKLSSDTTILVISHHLSTIKKADNIIVLNHGKVVEQGSHKQLVDAKGYYYKLMERQIADYE